MSARIYVGTRKGLFVVERGKHEASRWKIAQHYFLGDPVSMILPDARNNSIYVALNLGHFGVKFHRSQNKMKTWQEFPAPTFPEKPDDPSDTNPWSLKQIWSLEIGGGDEAGVIWAGTLPGGLFRSNDTGETWELNRPLWDKPERKGWFGGGYDTPGIHSICIDPRNSKHIRVGISCGGVWTSLDGGQSWANTSYGMRAAYMPPEKQNDLNIQDPHRMTQCQSQPDTFWIQHHNGIFRSLDGAKNWEEIIGVKPSIFGFAVATHPSDGNTAWFVPAIKDERRVPVDGKLVVTRTQDGGKTFDTLSEGLPQKNAYDLVYRHGLDIDETGRCLAMGSTTGNLWISENQGGTWKCVSTHLPPINCVRF